MARDICRRGKEGGEGGECITPPKRRQPVRLALRAVLLRHVKSHGEPRRLQARGGARAEDHVVLVVQNVKVLLVQKTQFPRLWRVVGS